MRAIYQYVVDYAKKHGGRVLDYGCGSGEIVESARSAGVDMVGADIFYAANDSGDVVRSKDLLNKVVFEIVDNRLPFDDASFDLVVSTQVFEHVTDLDAVLAEIARVLRPGGQLLTLFPSYEVWREGHCGIPFAHRFRRGSSLRVAYFYVMRTVGIGYARVGRTRRAFVHEWIDYLDTFTTYRRQRAITASFNQFFTSLRYIESDYVAYRLRHRGNQRLARLATIPGLAQLGSTACRKLAGLVIVASK